MSALTIRIKTTLSAARAACITYVLLAALWLTHVGTNVVWLKLDTRPPYWDSAAHLIAAIHYSRLPFLTNFPSALQNLFTSSVYPPLVYWLSAPLAFSARPTADVLTGIHALFLGVLLVSTFGLASAFGGSKAGLLAAFIVSMYPLVFGLTRLYLIDVPLVAMVALSNWLLIRTDNLGRRRESIVYGVSLGLGMLTKWPFAVFAIGPYVLTAMRTLVVHPRSRRLNLILSLLVGGLVAAPWYLCNWRSSLAFLGQMPVFAAAEGDPSTVSLVSWGYYGQVFINTQVLLPLAIFFVIGLIAVLIRYGFRYETMFLLSWIVVSYCFLSVFENKDPRYTLPYLPAVAIISAWGLTLVQPKVLKHSLVALLVLVASLQFVGASWGLSSLLPPGMLPGRVSMSLGSTALTLYAEGIHIVSPPRAENWQVQTILHDVLESRETPTESGSVTLAVLADAPFFECNTFRYYSAVERLPIYVLAVAGMTENPDARAQVAASDYVITKTGNLGPDWTTGQVLRFIQELEDLRSGLGRQFALVREYSLPDGSAARLYKRTHD